MLQLSYSAADEILSCEQKWVYKKVMRLEADPDANVDTLAFRFGKAFHWIHEVTEHELGYFEDKADELIEKACKDYSLPFDSSCYLFSAVLASMTLWKQTGLRVVRSEIKIEDDKFIGYVDFVAVCPTSGRWWIGDLKTTGMTENISARLNRDPQLSLYAARKQQIAGMLGLDVSLFAGALYRETVKPKSVIEVKKKKPPKPKKGEKPAPPPEAVPETPRSYAKRCIAETQMYVIKAEDIVDHQLSVHAVLHDRALKLQAGAMPIRNYKNCLAYKKKCDYWSRCYGKLGSDTHDYMLESTMYLTRKDTTSGAYELHAYSMQSEPLRYIPVDSAGQPDPTFQPTPLSEEWLKNVPPPGPQPLYYDPMRARTQPQPPRTQPQPPPYLADLGDLL